MRPNISIINALVRLTFGFTLLAWVTAQLTKRNHSNAMWMFAIVAAMKVGEGITRFCPLTFIFDRYKDDVKEAVQNTTEAVNPS
ncbi:MAG: hypothetical protein K0S51_2218 [Bacillales bacterium]|jgi:hypothetical protein|nr:hypothetical protein [Bacillales bacterium]